MRGGWYPGEPPVDYPVRARPPSPPIDYPLGPSSPPSNYARIQRTSTPHAVSAFGRAVNGSPTTPSSRYDRREVTREIPVQRELSVHHEGEESSWSGGTVGRRRKGGERRGSSSGWDELALSRQPSQPAPIPLSALHPDLRAAAERSGDNPAFLHHIKNHQLLSTVRAHRGEECPICRAMNGGSALTAQQRRPHSHSQPPSAASSRSGGHGSVKLRKKTPKDPSKPTSRWSYLPTLVSNRNRRYL